MSEDPVPTTYQLIRTALREQRMARQQASRIRTRRSAWVPLAASAIYLFGQTQFAQLLFQNGVDFLMMKLEDLRRLEQESGKHVEQMSQAEILDKLEQMNIRTARVAKNQFGEVIPFLLLEDESPNEEG
jgi:hypothetical protein